MDQEETPHPPEYICTDRATGRQTLLPLSHFPKETLLSGTVASISGDDVILTMEDTRFTGHLMCSALHHSPCQGDLLTELFLTYVELGGHLLLTPKESASDTRAADGLAPVTTGAFSTSPHGSRFLNE